MDRLKSGFAITICAALSLSMLSVDASAQSVNNPDPDNNLITPDSVNPEAGLLMIGRTEFAMGDEGDPLRLVFSRSYTNFNGVYSTSVDPFGVGWSHNYVLGAYLNNDETVANYGDLIIVIGNKQFDFVATYYNGVWTYDNTRPDGAKVEAARINNIGYAVLTTSDGYKYYFPHDDAHAVYTDSGVLGSSQTHSTLASMADKVEAPNGESLEFYYESTDSAGGSIRLKAIKHSRGYGLLFYYLDPSTGGSKSAPKQLVSKIVLMDHICTSFPVGCSETGLRSVSYTYQVGPANSNQYKLTSVTDLSNQTTRYGYDTYQIGLDKYQFPLTQIFQPADTTSPSFSVAYTDWNLIPRHKAPSAITIGQNQYTYAYDNYCGWDIGTTRTDPLGGRTRYTYSTPSSPDQGGCTPTNGGAVSKIVDPLMRQTTFTYDYLNLISPIYDRLVHRQTNPENDAIVYEYDDRGNKTKTTRVAKPQSGLSDVSQTATYLVCSATNYRSCNKPTYTIDARGARTDYEWSDVHGQLTRILRPPDANGVRPETTYTYGAFTGVSGNTFYLRTSETTKLSPTSSLTTSFEYDANNGFRLVGIVKTSGASSRRTCLSYDRYGFVSSKTEPRAGLVTCQ